MKTPASEKPERPLGGYYSPGQDIHFRLTTREEETELFVKARAGDETARTFLIQNHLLFARQEAMRQVKGALPDDEVISAANFAIMKAMDSFDHTLGFRFTTYLRPFITGEIAALWKSKYSAGVLDPSATAPRVFAQSVRIPGQEAWRKIGAQEGEEWTPHDPAVHPDQCDTHPGEANDLANFNREQLNIVLTKLDPRKRAVIEGRFGLNDQPRKTLDEMGQALKLTRERIRQLEAEALADLQKLLRRRGVVEVV
jgi:RNA polymerase sigma factor (sigma-70 family)